MALASISQGAEIFGGYSNGCIRGASKLTPGPLFQVQHWGPQRDFGHPALIDYINDLAKRASQHKLPPLLIGDLSKPYGGPFGGGSAHGSHNIGLDADISFDFASPGKSAYELSHPKDVYLVDQKGNPTGLSTLRQMTAGSRGSLWRQGSKERCAACMSAMVTQPPGFIKYAHGTVTAGICM